jgi:hypothetical protein
MQISFSDLPEVSADQPVVHGGLGQMVELSCLVYADPDPEVIWYRDTMRLDPNERRYVRVNGLQQINCGKQTWLRKTASYKSFSGGFLAMSMLVVQQEYIASSN